MRTVGGDIHMNTDGVLSKPAISSGSFGGVICICSAYSLRPMLDTLLCDLDQWRLGVQYLLRLISSATVGWPDGLTTTVFFGMLVMVSCCCWALNSMNARVIYVYSCFRVQQLG